MNKRKKTPGNVEAEVLIASKRRCTICFGIDGDVSEKKGQIAHLDKNPNNNKIDNICYLCLPHHDQYDSQTSVSKNYTIHEVKKYRCDLYDQIRDNFLTETKPRAELNRGISNSSYELLVFCGRIKEYFGGYPSTSEVSTYGRELLLGLRDNVLDFGHNEQIIQPLRDFENRVHIVSDDLLRDEDPRESKKDMMATYELLKKAINIGKPQQSINNTDDLKLFQMTVEAYKRKGTPKHFLDSQNLSNEQKADLYDRAIYSEKGRYPKSNPYKENV